MKQIENEKNENEKNTHEKITIGRLLQIVNSKI